ncbi:MAG: hypothetical protein ACRENU_08870 [Gemmatimonadaceae bacterium]
MIRTGNTPLADIEWGRSTTNVPMFVMGTHNGRNVIPLDVNDAGVIVGMLRLSGSPDQAFRWENGTFTVLGPTTVATVAKAISENGVVAGFSGFTGVRWDGTSMTPLPSSSNGSQASGINEAGIIVGADFLSASRWNGTRLDLPKPSGSTAVGFDVNNLGLVAGRITATAPPFGRPFIWQNTTGTVVILPPTGYSLTNAHAFQGRVINDAGNFIGSLQNGGTIRGFRHRAGTFEFLPSLSAARTFGIGIGEGGDVVGASEVAPDSLHAVVWSSTNQIRDLGMVTGANTSTANGVNRNGWVVGTSTTGSTTVGVIWRITGDDTPPQIGVTVEGTQGENGWYTSNVHVVWTTADGESGIASSTGCQEQNLSTDVEAVTYTCTATNGAGLSTTQSVTVHRDASQPVITTELTGVLGNNGWYRSDVSLSMSVADAHSGLAVSEGCVAHSIVEDTEELTFTCSATNNAGLSSSNTVTVKRDATKPVVVVSEHADVYDIDEHISIQCSVSDAMSGILSHTCAALDADAYTLAVKNHTYSVQAVDNAGNVTVASARFTVQVSLAALARLTLRLVVHEGQANALIQKLGNAASMLSKGNVKGAESMMDQYADQLRSMDSEKVSAGDAAILMALSDLVPMTQASAAMKASIRQ